MESNTYSAAPVLGETTNKSNNDAYSNDSHERSRLIPRGTTVPTKRAVVVQDSIDDDDEDSKGNTLLMYFGLMLICAMGNRLFGRLSVYPMHNYPLFMSLMLTVIYIPACFAYVIPALYFTNLITKEQTDIPKYKFAVMGAFDAIAGLLSTFSVNYITSSTLVVLVGQSAIPISMLVSKITLKSKYTIAQYSGATVVMLGIVSVLLPKFLLTQPGPHIPDASSHSTDTDAAAFDDTDPALLDTTTNLPLEQAAAASGDFNSSAGMQIVWVMVQIISCVPMCLSSVYKEKALGEVEIDVNYLNGWVAVFQFMLAIPLCIPSAQIQGIPLNGLIPNLQGGFRCWMGINTVTEENNPYDQQLDNCTMAPLFVTGFISFNLVYNILTVVILKYGSANILWLASTILVPLSNVAFSLKFMPGSQPMTIFDLIGLIIIMMGLVIYRFSEQLLAVWSQLFGRVKNATEIKRDNLKKRISRKLERKQIQYMGINQIESINALVDTRVMRAQMELLVRSPQTIRESYLMSVGVDPSPHLTVRSYAHRSPVPGERGFTQMTSRNSSFVERAYRGNTATFTELGRGNSMMADRDGDRSFAPVTRGESFVGVASRRPDSPPSTRSRNGSAAQPPLPISSRRRSGSAPEQCNSNYGAIAMQDLKTDDNV